MVGLEARDQGATRRQPSRDGAETCIDFGLEAVHGVEDLFRVGVVRGSAAARSYEGGEGAEGAGLEDRTARGHGPHQ
jgi:hypothetical protein